jgi:4'-phosphopantetheinyl transferase
MAATSIIVSDSALRTRSLCSTAGPGEAGATGSRQQTVVPGRIGMLRLSLGVWVPGNYAAVSDGSVHIWRVSAVQEPAAIYDLEQLLSDEERARAWRFHFARDRNLFTVTRAALRQILGACLGIAPSMVLFAAGPFGKPCLPDGGVRFNVSHSGSLALIAVARDREVGVDVEAVRHIEDAASIATRFFSADESRKIGALLNSSSLPRAFFECWTRKEAFIKALGEGLSHPLDTFDVTFFPDKPVALRVHGDERCGWTLINIDPGPGYCGALVTENTGSDDSNPSVCLWDWTPDTLNSR